MDLDAGRSYEFLKEIDEGAYGSVYACVQHPLGRIVAVKQCKHTEDATVRRLLLREIRILRSLSPHPCVVTLLDAFRSQGSGRPYLVFEHMERSLHKELDALDSAGIAMPPEALKLVAWQLALAIDHLHAQKVVHRDIKPANVLLSGVGTGTFAKLCDFGFAREVASGRPEAQERMSTYVVTRWYRAPEILVGDRYGMASDVWSLGCTLAEMAAGGVPLFPGASTLDQLARIMRCCGPLPPGQTLCLHTDKRLAPLRKPPPRSRNLAERLKGIDPHLLDLISSCLTLDPARRPSARALVGARYFRDVPLLLAGSPALSVALQPCMLALALAQQDQARHLQQAQAQAQAQVSRKQPRDLPPQPTSAVSVMTVADAAAAAAAAAAEAAGAGAPQQPSAPGNGAAEPGVLLSPPHKLQALGPRGGAVHAAGPIAAAAAFAQSGPSPQPGTARDAPPMAAVVPADADAAVRGSSGFDAMPQQPLRSIFDAGAAEAALRAAAAGAIITAGGTSKGGHVAEMAAAHAAAQDRRSEAAAGSPAAAAAAMVDISTAAATAAASGSPAAAQSARFASSVPSVVLPKSWLQRRASAAPCSADEEPAAAAAAAAHAAAAAPGSDAPISPVARLAGSAAAGAAGGNGGSAAARSFAIGGSDSCHVAAAGRRVHDGAHSLLASAVAVLPQRAPQQQPAAPSKAPALTRSATSGDEPAAAAATASSLLLPAALASHPHPQQPPLSRTQSKGRNGLNSYARLFLARRSATSIPECHPPPQQHLVTSSSPPQLPPTAASQSSCGPPPNTCTGSSLPTTSGPGGTGCGGAGGTSGVGVGGSGVGAFMAGLMSTFSRFSASHTLTTTTNTLMGSSLGIPAPAGGAASRWDMPDFAMLPDGDKEHGRPRDHAREKSASINVAASTAAPRAHRPLSTAQVLFASIVGSPPGSDSSRLLSEVMASPAGVPAPRVPAGGGGGGGGGGARRRLDLPHVRREVTVTGLESVGDINSIGGGAGGAGLSHAGCANRPSGSLGNLSLLMGYGSAGGPEGGATTAGGGDGVGAGGAGGSGGGACSQGPNDQQQPSGVISIWSLYNTSSFRRQHPPTSCLSRSSTVGGGGPAAAGAAAVPHVVYEAPIGGAGGSRPISAVSATQSGTAASPQPTTAAAAAAAVAAARRASAAPRQQQVPQQKQQKQKRSVSQLFTTASSLDCALMLQPSGGAAAAAAATAGNDNMSMLLTSGGDFAATAEVMAGARGLPAAAAAAVAAGAATRAGGGADAAAAGTTPGSIHLLSTSGGDLPELMSTTSQLLRSGYAAAGHQSAVLGASCGADGRARSAGGVNLLLQSGGGDGGCVRAAAHAAGRRVTLGALVEGAAEQAASAAACKVRVTMPAGVSGHEDELTVAPQPAASYEPAAAITTAATTYQYQAAADTGGALRSASFTSQSLAPRPKSSAEVREPGAARVPGAPRLQRRPSQQLISDGAAPAGPLSLMPLPPSRAATAHALSRFASDHLAAAPASVTSAPGTSASASSTSSFIATTAAGAAAGAAAAAVGDGAMRLSPQASKLGRAMAAPLAVGGDGGGLSVAAVSTGVRSQTRLPHMCGPVVDREEGLGCGAPADKDRSDASRGVGKVARWFARVFACGAHPQPPPARR
ncbi:hypothetical protein HXX76_013274 [Chlamydomonas incerta]|uniref:cyclin-dependent kinase n=1 Tax=Chlamydomonas incerta TaxID=51695 RepID=A0A835VUY6_CHLIN|nr:hypothetical protein HXX76_013274 [Chlamydomonas incerta]|eukprot:KAG2426086.1 hypothetical protein HXX76_013274 [Chlamydomonas incerta]